MRHFLAHYWQLHVDLPSIFPPNESPMLPGRYILNGVPFHGHRCFPIQVLVSPHQPLFDLQFIYSTVTVFAEMAIAFGLIGLLMVPATFRTSGWRQWFFVVSVLLASAGFSGGAWVISLVGRGS